MGGESRARENFAGAIGDEAAADGGTVNCNAVCGIQAEEEAEGSYQRKNLDEPKST